MSQPPVTEVDDDVLSHEDDEEVRATSVSRMSRTSSVLNETVSRLEAFMERQSNSLETNIVRLAGEQQTFMQRQANSLETGIQRLASEQQRQSAEQQSNIQRLASEQQNNIQRLSSDQQSFIQRQEGMLGEVMNRLQKLELPKMTSTVPKSSVAPTTTNPDYRLSISKEESKYAEAPPMVTSCPEVPRNPLVSLTTSHSVTENPRVGSPPTLRRSARLSQLGRPCYKESGLRYISPKRLNPLPEETGIPVLSLRSVQQLERHPPWAVEQEGHSLIGEFATIGDWNDGIDRLREKERIRPRQEEETLYRLENEQEIFRMLEARGEEEEIEIDNRSERSSIIEFDTDVRERMIDTNVRPSVEMLESRPNFELHKETRLHLYDHLNSGGMTHKLLNHPTTGRGRCFDQNPTSSKENWSHFGESMSHTATTVQPSTITAGLNTWIYPGIKPTSWPNLRAQPTYVWSTDVVDHHTSSRLHSNLPHPPPAPAVASSSAWPTQRISSMPYATTGESNTFSVTCRRSSSARVKENERMFETGIYIPTEPPAGLTKLGAQLFTMKETMSSQTLQPTKELVGAQSQTLGAWINKEMLPVLTTSVATQTMMSGDISVTKDIKSTAEEINKTVALPAVV